MLDLFSAHIRRPPLSVERAREGQQQRARAKPVVAVRGGRGVAAGRADRGAWAPRGSKDTDRGRANAAAPEERSTGGRAVRHKEGRGDEQPALAAVCAGQEQGATDNQGAVQHPISGRFVFGFVFALSLVSRLRARGEMLGKSRLTKVRLALP